MNAHPNALHGQEAAHRREIASLQTRLASDRSRLACLGPGSEFPLRFYGDPNNGVGYLWTFNNLQNASEPRFDFNPGLPDLTSFPRAAWVRALRRGLLRAATASLGSTTQRVAPRFEGPWPPTSSARGVSPFYGLNVYINQPYV